METKTRKAPMKTRRSSQPKSRRQALTAAFAVLGGGAAAGAAADRTGAPQAASSPPRDEAWTPKKAAISRPGQTPQPGALLSSCIRSGHLLFVSGIGGWYPDRRKEPGDVKVQIQSALTSMKELLETAGSSMANVLKVHMTVADASKNIALLNEGYRGFFPDPPPARSYTGVPAEQIGRPGVLVQVDCVAYVD